MNFRLVLPRPIIAVLAVMGLLFAIDLFALGAARRLAQAEAGLAREIRALTAVSALPVMVLQMESGVRGYLLNGDPAALAQYRAASDALQGAIADAGAESADDPELRGSLAEASALAAKWLDGHLSPLVVKRNAGEGSSASMRAILQALRTGRGEAVARKVKEQLGIAWTVQDRRVQAAQGRLQAAGETVGRWMQVRAIALLVAVAALALLLGRTLMRLTGQTSSREAAEKNAREYSATLTAMNDAAPLGMFVTDAAGACNAANAAFERITGMPGENLGGTGWHTAIHPDDRERVQAAWDKAVAERAQFVSEHRFVHRNGEVVWVSLKTAAMMDGDSLIGLVCTVEDVTERRNAEDGLRRSEERLRLALEAASLAMFDWHVPSGEIVFSRHWASLLDSPREPTTTTVRRLTEMLHEDDRERLREAVIESFKGRSARFSVSFRVRTAHGLWKRVEARGHVTERDALGRAVQVTGTLAETA